MEQFKFTVKQKGYGRQGLYANGVYIMDVFPNVEEHFGIVHENDAFYNEETEQYTDGNGNEIEEGCLYSNKDEWLSKHLQDEVLAALAENE